MFLGFLWIASQGNSTPGGAAMLPAEGHGCGLLGRQEGRISLEFMGFAREMDEFGMGVDKDL